MNNPLMDAILSRSRSKNLLATLSLTSLIDAFSILVIYLLLVTQNGLVDVDLRSQLHLPSSEQAPFIEKEPFVIRLENGQFFIKKYALTANQLITLIKNKVDKIPDGKIAIQADQDQNFGQIQGLIQHLQTAGIYKIELLTERFQ